MASRMVANESAKCRSGRELVRISWMVPSDRGGETPHTLRYDEGVAANRDGNVVMPTWETAALEVVEPELALHVLIDALGAVALLEEAYELLLAHLATQRGPM